ncbi:protein TolR [Acinetobacter indicus]|uniref:protein TolR n=1 Tax=Acinetobacter TaxID=469 RepID=UPI0002CDAF48|nr:MULTISPECIES: protein TolR [Acinetobacter]ENW90696.1 protein TolR [Acinetobacter sp. CIP 53.82]MBA0155369.1 protein TolR [Acinetobacter indicus]MDM1276274.1 protein TolR [Acinetobacter indicus]MDM1279567.1 protein TolR [Acinetobacter indicus]MDM1300489.1 protein TolR [Acinetobacter indicus]
MQKRQKKHALNAEMNVVPYIDVMLVLLVIFMVTAPMLTQGIKVNLPNLEAETLVTPKEQKVITISIQEDGRYYWNVGESVDTTQVTDRATSLTEMKEKLSPLLQIHQDIQVFIRADRSANYELVAQTIGLLQQSGVEQLGLVTEEQDQ